MAADRTDTTARTFRWRDGRLLSAGSAAAGAWLGGYAGNRIGTAIAGSRGQRGLDGILLESVAALLGFLAGVWLLVLVALAVAGRSRPILTATLAAASAAAGLVAVVLLEWVFDLVWSPESTWGWHEPVVLTLVPAAGGYAARRFAVRPPRRSTRPRTGAG